MERRVVVGGVAGCEDAVADELCIGRPPLGFAVAIEQCRVTLGDRVRVKSIASRRSDRAAAVAASVGAELTDDLMSAVRDPDVDAVDICLPTPLHREWAEESFAAGKHVLLEKPIALSLEDADAIVAAA